jgi:hypothetical protein
MTEYANDATHERWLECLHVVHSLSAEMQAALAALAANDLKRFEGSVREQDRICETARGSARLLAAGSRPRAQLAAARELQQQGRVYAAAVARAAQVCAALLSLYRESPRGYAADGPTPPDCATWSCEV